jgi:hypothetical protein
VQHKAVLKLAMPHMEGKHEIQGLRYRRGRSTVKLLEADEDSGAMLLERCLPGTTLRSEIGPAQDVIIAGVLRRVWESTTEAACLDDFRPLSAMINFWCEETIAQKHVSFMEEPTFSFPTGRMAWFLLERIGDFARSFDVKPRRAVRKPPGDCLLRAA